MTHPAPIRFGGYTPHLKDPTANLHLPGHQLAQTVLAEWIPPGHTKPVNAAMVKDGGYWRLAKPLPLGSHYRFVVDGQPTLDWSETRPVTMANGKQVTYNHIDNPGNTVLPTSHGSMLDVFQSSIRLDKPANGQFSLGQTTHTNQNQPVQKGLFALLDQLPTGAVRNVLLRPIQQGGYWTQNPYVLDPQHFKSKTEFRQYLDKLREKGMRLYMDTALVNQGLQGPQYLSNLQHGLRSPYWDWFPSADPNSPPGEYPHNAYNGSKIGVLPLNPDGSVNWQHTQLSVANVPGSKNYNPNVHTELVLTGLPPAPSQPQDTHATDQPQTYRFPITNPKEAQVKLAAMAKQSISPTSTQGKQQLAQWTGLQLTPPGQDDSGYKWDGQIDVAKLNIENPQVKAYLQGSVTYWTRFVTYHQTKKLAHALQRQLNKKMVFPHVPNAWAKEIEGKAFKAKPGAWPKLDWDCGWKPGPPTVEVSVPDPAPLAERLFNVAPLSAEGHTWAQQAVLGHPDLLPMLQRSSALQQGGYASAKALTAPIAKVAQLFKQPTPSVPLQSFKQALVAQLNYAVHRVSPETMLILRDERLRDMAMFELGEALWPQLIGQYTVPPHLDPNMGVALMAQHLTQQLRRLPKDWAFKQLSQQWQGLTYNSLRLADTLVQTHELGPNLRIDAAKDLGNTSAINQLPLGQARQQRFLTETDKTVQHWQDLLTPARQIYPPMSVIAELTDLEKLAGDKATAQKALHRYSKVFTGTPDMDHMFGLGYQLVHYSPTPHEYGDSQRYLGSAPGKPGLIEQLRQRAQTVPVNAQHQFQTMVSSHDYSTAFHNVLHNPALATQDKLAYWGLQQDLEQAINELTTKPCFADVRQQLYGQGVVNPAHALQRVQHNVDALGKKGELSPAVQAMLTQQTKQAHGVIAATPQDVKRQLIEDVMGRVSPAGLGLPDEAAQQALTQALIQRLTEPSEVRALRATLNNAWQDLLAKNPQWQALSTPVFKGLNAVLQQYGRHAGYQPIDLVLDRTFNAIKPAQLVAKGQPVNAAALKQQWLQKAMQPALDKMLRLTALQVGTPGIPSVTLHDYYPPGGGETGKNATVQNRGPIALGHANSQIKAYQAEVNKLLALRQQWPVLDNGLLLPPCHPDDEYALSQQGVMPFIRDNGKDQAIMLVNTGNPKGLDWANKVGLDGTRYDAPYATQLRVPNARINLHHLQMPLHTQYKDATTGMLYVINAQGQLVQKDNPKQGPAVTVATVLIRQPE
jgi:hypothetical protein